MNTHSGGGGGGGRRGGRVLDVFAGIGGVSAGVERAGGTVVARVENNRACLRVLQRAVEAGVLSDAEHVGDDIRQVDFTRWAGAVDGVVGGPPCQAFSRAARWMLADGRRVDGGGGGERRLTLGMEMVEEFYRAVRESEARWFVMENVPGLLEVSGGGLRAMRARAGGDWAVRMLWLDARDFGLPQHRERIFYVGMRDGGGLDGGALVPRREGGEWPWWVGVDGFGEVGGGGGFKTVTSWWQYGIEAAKTAQGLEEWAGVSLRQVANAAPPPMIQAIVSRLI